MILIYYIFNGVFAKVDKTTDKKGAIVSRGTIFRYLPKSNSNMLTSAGDMPGIREACATVSGSIFTSF